MDENLGIKLRQMAKFRNRLVHLYGEIDDAYVYEFIGKDLVDDLDGDLVELDRQLETAPYQVP